VTHTLVQQWLVGQQLFTGRLEGGVYTVLEG